MLNNRLSIAGASLQIHTLALKRGMAAYIVPVCQATHEAWGAWVMKSRSDYSIIAVELIVQAGECVMFRGDQYPDLIAQLTMQKTLTPAPIACSCAHLTGHLEV